MCKKHHIFGGGVVECADHHMGSSFKIRGLSIFKKPKLDLSALDMYFCKLLLHIIKTDLPKRLCKP